MSSFGQESAPETYRGPCISYLYIPRRRCTSRSVAGTYVDRGTYYVSPRHVQVRLPPWPDPRPLTQSTMVTSLSDTRVYLISTVCVSETQPEHRAVFVKKQFLNVNVAPTVALFVLVWALEDKNVLCLGGSDTQAVTSRKQRVATAYRSRFSAVMRQDVETAWGSRRKLDRTQITKRLDLGTVNGLYLYETWAPSVWPGSVCAKSDQMSLEPCWWHSKSWPCKTVW